MKTRVAIIAGGDSGEYEVSISSAASVSEQLDKAVYDVYTIYMQKTDWYHQDEKAGKVQVDKNDFSIVLNGERIRFDIAFILIHGTPGEDGKLQGYFELMGIPYTTSDLFTSTLTFKKSFTKHVARALDISISKSIYLSSVDSRSPQDLINELGLPCFVKPNKGGSSVGVTKVKDQNELESAIRRAFEEDDEILVEEYLEGTEINCGMYMSRDEIVPLPLTEIVPKTDFFDYEAKYLGASDEITPARINEEKTRRCQELSVFLYREFNCKGLVRFDYILKDNIFYFLEVNTIPGLSSASIVPQQIRYMGKTETEVYGELIEDAMRRR
ncbi:MAG: D-alanine--D-alanine ligase [Bacteroidales bacterium]|nr:D-alanine--D-alanine ligase [Bacteroidales bacterium]MCF8337721.1 D-alanine--D-alanine ligase [Bacteroidales bacterium]